MDSRETVDWFANEASFIFWLSGLMRDNAEYSEIALQPRIGSGRSGGRMAEADIIAIRTRKSKKETLLIECKNYSVLYGERLSSAIKQLSEYGQMRSDAHLVLAFPGNLAPGAGEILRTSNIEVWDLNNIARLFDEQIRRAPPISMNHLKIVEEQSFEKEEDLLLKDLKLCNAGKEQWAIYQKLVGRIIAHLFCPPLQAPLVELGDFSGVNRRDFILANFAEKGFWKHVQTRYNADYIVVDAKNYRGKVKKKDILQIANYLKLFGTGLFAIIFCRNGADNSAFVTAREQWAVYGKLVLVVDDRDCEAMLRALPAGDPTEVLAKLIQDFRLAM